MNEGMKIQIKEVGNGYLVSKNYNETVRMIEGVSSFDHVRLAMLKAVLEMTGGAPVGDYELVIKHGYPRCEVAIPTTIEDRGNSCRAGV